MTGSYPYHVDPRAVADDGDEVTIQSRFRNRIRKLAPGCQVVAIPNGGNRTQWERLKAKREGLVAGFPDLMILWPGGQAFLEFKARNGALSDAQLGQLMWLHRAGYPTGVFRSVETAIEFMRDAGLPMIEQAAA